MNTTGVSQQYWLRSMFFTFAHEMKATLKSPYFVIGSLAQPVLYLFLFGPTLTGIPEISSGGAGGAYGVFVPALFIQLAIFSSSFAGISLVTEYRSGAFERLFATPVSRSAMLAGKVVKDSLVVVAEMIIVLLLAYPLGYRTSGLGLVVDMLLVFLTAVSFSSLSYLVAILTKQEDALSSIFNAVLLPLILLSGILIPIDFGPHWLRVLSRFNPLTYVVEGARQAVGVGMSKGTAVSIIVAFILAVICFEAAAQAFKGKSRT